MEGFQPVTFTQQRYPVHRVELDPELDHGLVQNLARVRNHALVTADTILTLHMVRHLNQFQMVFLHLQYFLAIISPPFLDNRISVIQIVPGDYFILSQFNGCLAIEFFCNKLKMHSI
jgi:hypothetical protein